MELTHSVKTNSLQAVNGLVQGLNEFIEKYEQDDKAAYNARAILKQFQEKKKKEEKLHNQEIDRLAKEFNGEVVKT